MYKDASLEEMTPDGEGKDIASSSAEGAVEMAAGGFEEHGP